jgi:hypothetical protein
MIEMNKLSENWTSLAAIHKDLLDAKEFLYAKCGFDCTLPIAESESKEYGAYTFKVNGLSILFRVAKITPTKTGQFVTLWKRHENGAIQPIDTSDHIDLFVISTRKESDWGQFVFPKSVLLEKGILSNSVQLPEHGAIISGTNHGGKRAIRVYPPWDKTTNKQAQKTQQWQLEYFIEIAKDNPIDLARAQMLFQS